MDAHAGNLAASWRQIGIASLRHTPLPQQRQPPRDGDRRRSAERQGHQTSDDKRSLLHADTTPHSGHGPLAPRLSYPHAAHRPRPRRTTRRPHSPIAIITPQPPANTAESTANPLQIGHNGNTRAEPGVFIALAPIPPRTPTPPDASSSISHHIESIGHPRASSSPAPALAKSPARIRGRRPQDRS